MTDLAFRVLYRCAYRAMRVYWAVFHPRAHGALVAVWHGGEVLLVHTSYAAYYQFPGGYVRRGETGAEAASREVLEELGLRVEPGALVPVADVEHVWEGKRERVEIFELSPPGRPSVEIDDREVVDARFVAPEQALQLALFPPVREVIERRARAELAR
jgi:8-oxo-dGTP pyrophosphatase MutT (NUDIX family)